MSANVTVSPDALRAIGEGAVALERRRILIAIDEIVADIEDCDEVRDRDLLHRIRLAVQS